MAVYYIRLAFSHPYAIERNSFFNNLHKFKYLVNGTRSLKLLFYMEIQYTAHISFADTTGIDFKINATGLHLVKYVK